MLYLATKFRPHLAAFETARQAGFRSAEFWLDAALLEDWRRIAELARRYPFRYALHFPNRGELAPRHLDQAVRLYRELECTAMVIHQPMYDAYGQQLLQRDEDLQLAIENHRLDESSLARWACTSPGLTLDVEHLWKFTLHDAPLDCLLDQLDVLLARHMDKLRHVHLPGYWAGCSEHRPMHQGREMVVPVLSLLADYRYDRLIVSEANEAFQNLDHLTRDMRVYQSWLSQRAVRN